MLTGLMRVIDAAGMEKVHGSALQVLEKTGLLIRGDYLLKALADFGCKVDFAAQRAWFKPDLVERQIATQRGRYRMVRSSLWYPFCKSLPADDAAWPDEFTVDYGFTTPWIYDYPQGVFRTPTSEDQIDMIMLGNALEPARAVCAPFICGDFDPLIEPMETARTLLLHTDKPGWVTTSDARQVKYFAELAALAWEIRERSGGTDTGHASGDASAGGAGASSGEPASREEYFKTMPPFFAHAYCTTSPLKLDTFACEVLHEALKHQFPVNFAPMPILGGTTPVTPAGSLVVAVAEILGCITAVTLIDPSVFCYATAISGEMDMRTTQICYATPASVLTDAALHQLFRYKYGIVLNVEPAYIEAKCPGIQATFMKLFRQMAFGCTASLPLPIGLLDNASAFSPTQAMIDLDINRALYRFGLGLDISDETLCEDLINRMEFCGKEAYLQTDHTLEHFREVLWDTRLFDRTYRKEGAHLPEKADARILEEADREWRRLVASQTPPRREPGFKAEIDRIVEAARRELST
jgi:trimethylamine:corrinoid methyltransferase-like protein